MLELERKYSDKYRLIAGIDEAGRGPLAGPVVCACVILPPGYKNGEINDSKQLSALTRERLYDIIVRDAVCFSTSVQSSRTVDEINILNATKAGMSDCLSTLAVKPNFVLTDAVRIKTDLPFEAIIKGDTLSLNIAAASIIAKVTRDRIMCEYDGKYQGYLFAKHKGYGTKEHIGIIKKLGATDIHRTTFLRNIMQEQCSLPGVIT